MHKLITGTSKNILVYHQSQCSNLQKSIQQPFKRKNVFNRLYSDLAKKGLLGEKSVKPSHTSKKVPLQSWS